MDGFRSTWSRANAAFGEGEPASGSEFDDSGRLRELQRVVETAAPGSRWTGATSESYATTNARRAAVFGDIADLDQRLGAEVDRSAAVVTAGRRDLDQLRTWVTDVAASTPQGRSGEWMRMTIATKGIGQISQIVEQSTTEMGAIGKKLNDIAREYDQLRPIDW